MKKTPKEKPITSHNYNLSSDEEERVYNLRSLGPIPEPDPETPGEKNVHETEPESESDTEETTTEGMPKVKRVDGKIIVKERTFGLKCCHKNHQGSALYVTKMSKGTYPAYY